MKSTSRVQNPQEGPAPSEQTGARDQRQGRGQKLPSRTEDTNLQMQEARWTASPASSDPPQGDPHAGNVCELGGALHGRLRARGQLDGAAPGPAQPLRGRVKTAGVPAEGFLMAAGCPSRQNKVWTLLQSAQIQGQAARPGGLCDGQPTDSGTLMHDPSPQSFAGGHPVSKGVTRGWVTGWGRGGPYGTVCMG